MEIKDRLNHYKTVLAHFKTLPDSEARGLCHFIVSEDGKTKTLLRGNDITQFPEFLDLRPETNHYNSALADADAACACKQYWWNPTERKPREEYMKKVIAFTEQKIKEQLK